MSLSHTTPHTTHTRTHTFSVLLPLLPSLPPSLSFYPSLYLSAPPHTSHSPDPLLTPTPPPPWPHSPFHTESPPAHSPSRRVSELTFGSESASLRVSLDPPTRYQARPSRRRLGPLASSIRVPPTRAAGTRRAGLGLARHGAVSGLGSRWPGHFRFSSCFGPVSMPVLQPGHSR
jgi:hypothetical protein